VSKRSPLYWRLEQEGLEAAVVRVELALAVQVELALEHCHNYTCIGSNRSCRHLYADSCADTMAVRVRCLPARSLCTPCLCMQILQRILAPASNHILHHLRFLLHCHTGMQAYNFHGSKSQRLQQCASLHWHWQHGNDPH
jgi:hypothetical protein